MTDLSSGVDPQPADKVDPDRDVRAAIFATRDEWEEMDWQMRSRYRWLIRSTEAADV